MGQWHVSTTASSGTALTCGFQHDNDQKVMAVTQTWWIRLKVDISDGEEKAMS